MVALVIFIGLLAAALVLLVAVGYLLAPRRSSEVKERRFEAGNPPYGEAKRRLVMQYIGYIYLATAIEALVGIMIIAALLGVDVKLLAAVGGALGAVLVFVARYIKDVADVKKWK
ncbi:MAG: hypothetical protein ABWK05_07620 [Pyrobaculum sp.]